MKNLFNYILILTFTMIGCDRKDSAPKSETLFSTISSELTGIHFKNIVKENLYFNFLNYTYIYNGGGVAAGDINNDGLIDLYFTSNQQSNKLYLNKGDFRFKDITNKANVRDGNGWTTGVTMVDINNDGYLDIYVSKSGSLNNDHLRRNKLYINQRDNTFEEQGRRYNLDDAGFATQAYFFDYDKDDDLDLYIVNHRPDFMNNVTVEVNGHQNPYPYSSDQLYRNDNGRFANVTQSAGVTNNAWGLSAAIGDFNNDTYPDVYICNDFLESDFLYINNQDGTFTNRILEKTGHISANSMGSDFADINNDLYPDLLVLDMTPEDHVRSKENMATMSTENFHTIVNMGHHHQYMANTLQLNNKNGQFSEIGQLAGIAKTDWSWAPLLADFDNDGFKDLFVTNGIARELNNQDFRTNIKRNIRSGIKMELDEAINMMPSEKLENYIYRNNGDLTFTNTIDTWGLSQKTYSNGTAYADLDNDGDLDLVVNNVDEEASIYRNNSTNNFVQIELTGGEINPSGIGAKVTVTTGFNSQYQEQYLSRGYQSSISPVMNFGLGSADKISRIKIEWPNGAISNYEDLAVNKKHSLHVNDAKMNSKKSGLWNPYYTEESPNQLGIDFTHMENSFDDFQNQVLLPHSQSHNGPFITAGDVNNDGLDDFFIGGAAKQSGVLYIQLIDGLFQFQNGPWENDKDQEDLGALLFDSDNDDDLDLYVVSGGSEFPVNSEQFQDRLYLNDGNGNFHKSANLPKIRSSGQVVRASDIDNDGDLDLFVGGRIIPDQYPYPPQSYILENSGGRFNNIISEAAPDLERIGMVTGADFMDYDSDGDDDLIVVGEWMPIQIFENNNGKFAKAAIPDLDSTNGLWFSVATHDIDQDGDIDFLAGNMGLNTKFKTTGGKEFHIYCDDFDFNGTYDIVLTSNYKGIQVPVRGRECATDQMPFIGEKFPTFTEFANAGLSDIFGDQNLNEAIHYQANTLASVFIENLGDGYFKITPLPNEAQISPIHDFHIRGNNLKTEIIAVGNLYNTEVETIRQDASFGTVFNYTNNQFKVVPNETSGFVSKGDAKNLAKVKTNYGEFIFVTNNNDALNIFKRTQNR